MDDFRYFIDKFISKQKKNRWLQFVEKAKWDKIGDQLHGLDRDMNDKCVLHETNGFEAFRSMVAKRNVRHGTYIDVDGAKTVSGDLTAQDIRDDSLIVCQQAKVAFYFSHEGWVWICSE
jgi:hypothetical protein